MNKKTVNFISILSFAFLWQICAVLAKNPLVFPTFTATISKFFELCATRDFWQSTLFSSLRVFAGFFISVFFHYKLISSKHQQVNYSDDG